MLLKPSQMVQESEAFGTITRRLMCYPHVQLVCFIDVDVVNVCVVNIVAELLLGIFLIVDVIFSPSIFYSGVVRLSLVLVLSQLEFLLEPSFCG